MFYVGQEVECIDASGSHREVKISPLVKGAIYTIRAFDYRSPPKTGLFLVGIVVPSRIWRELSFDSVRFRPVTKRKTDISIFTDMLKPADERVTA